MSTGKTLGIMQPYFLPYIGYFQLIGAVDEFVIYDQIKFTKKGWINRNRFLLNGDAAFFTLPLNKSSDSSDVVERRLADTFDPDKLLNQINGAYRKAPYFKAVYPLVERIVSFDNRNLFEYIHHSVALVCEHIGIATPILASSSISFDNTLKSQEKVIAICKAREAVRYINPIGGNELYSRDQFAQAGIKLQFLESCPVEYVQFGDGFVSSLSILDVLMFNSLKTVADAVSNNYGIV